jgi:osmotically-inducible protein OsmY
LNWDNEDEAYVSSGSERPDPDIVRDAVAAIRGQLLISSEHINVVVVNGWVTLEGHVEWQYQKSTAEIRVAGAQWRSRHRQQYRSGAGALTGRDQA